MLLWIFLCNEGVSCVAMKASTPSLQRNITMGILHVPQRARGARVNVNGKQDSVGERLTNNDPMTKYCRRQSARNRDGIVCRKKMG